MIPGANPLISTQNIPGARKAALLSVLLGEDVSGEVMKNLEEDEVHIIGREMARIQSVSSEEADVEKGMISTTSPIGRALLNKKVGDEIQVSTPAGQKEFEVVRLVTIHDEP